MIKVNLYSLYCIYIEFKFKSNSHSYYEYSNDSDLIKKKY